MSTGVDFRPLDLQPIFVALKEVDLARRNPEQLCTDQQEVIARYILVNAHGLSNTSLSLNLQSQGEREP